VHGAQCRRVGTNNKQSTNLNHEIQQTIAAEQNLAAIVRAAPEQLRREF